MKIKGLWLTSRSSDYHMQSWRNSRPPSESDWVVATTRTPSPSVAICPTTTKSVYLPKRGGWKGKKITSDSDSDVEWSDRACKWTMGPPVQRLTRRLPREIRVLSYEASATGRKIRISGEIINHTKQYNWVGYTPQEINWDLFRSWNRQRNSPSRIKLFWFWFLKLIC